MGACASACVRACVRKRLVALFLTDYPVPTAGLLECRAGERGGAHEAEHEAHRPLLDEGRHERRAQARRVARGR